MENSKNSNHHPGGSCGITPKESEYMTGMEDHVCTGQCAHIHWSARPRDFEQHVQQLSTTLPVRDFLWYRDSVAAIFAMEDASMNPFPFIILVAAQ